MMMNTLLAKIQLYKRQIRIVVFLLLFIVIILFAIKLLYSSKNSHHNTQTRVPVSVQKIAFHRDSKLDQGIPPGSLPSLEQLSTREMQFPEAKAQTFVGQSATEHGTFVVTSTLSGVTILIDTPNGAEASAASFVPTNTVPVKMSQMPAGYYIIDARKDGFDQSGFIVRIEPDKITRLNIALRPLPSQ
ncbi:MAG TPA: hypothetical protein VNW29_02695 [Candidatus Sulfotelmatobacter sp.]|jgi:hypothetical protein|nr:hypothetical protein [Candidatus Sulfotelmatobacter sp.]